MRALITGAARGLGKDLALKLVRRGYEVLLTDLPSPELEGVAQQINAAGGHAEFFAADLTRADELAKLVEWVRAGSSLDLLVNNAGFVRGGGHVRAAWADHERTFAVNLTAPMRLLYDLLPLVIQSPVGGVITVASASGLLGLPYAASYSSSKWAVIGLHESLRQEMIEDGHRHLRFLCACPSYIDTGLFAGARAPMPLPFLHSAPLAEKILRRWERGNPYLLEPFMVKLLPLMKGIFPRWLQDCMFRLLGIQHGMKNWRGR